MRSTPNSGAISALARLCELDPPLVSGQFTSVGASARVSRLIDIGALVPAGSAEVITCFACDEPHDVAIEITEGGSYRAFCPEAGFQHVSPEALRLYSVDFGWLVAGLAAALSMRRPDAAEGPEEPPVHRIGPARFGSFRCHLFFGRRLFDRGRLQAALHEVSRMTSAMPPIIVTSTPLDRVAGGNLPRCGLVALTDVLSFEDKPNVDEEPFRALLTGKPGQPADSLGVNFSLGFRTAGLAGESYKFTKKQAAIIEELYKARQAGTPNRHFHELQAAANTSQTISQVFRKHPAYGTLIQHDRQGHYWLTPDV